MANKCWNNFDFYGNKEVENQVLIWRDNINELIKSKSAADCHKIVYEVFYPDEELDKINLGSKWVEPDFHQSTDSSLNLLSAWGPPDDLQNKITNILFGLDKEVVVVNHYNTESYENGFRYTTVMGDSEIYSQYAAIGTEDNPLQNMDDIYSNENILQITEWELDCLADLINDFPTRAKRLSSEIKKLQKNFDKLRK